MTMFTTSRSVVVGCALVALGVVCLAQEPTREKQPAKDTNRLKPSEQVEKIAPRTESADQLWKQIGQLHRQIVMLEMHPTGPAAGTATAPESPPTPGSQPKAAPTTPTRPENDLLLNQLRPEDALKQIQGAVGAITSHSSEGLWTQIAQLHKQIVQLEAADAPSRTERAFRGTEEPEKNSGPAAKESKAPATLEPNKTHATEKTGADSRHSQIEQLWSRIADLQQQIVAMEVKELKSRKSDGAQPSAPTSESSTRTED